MPLLKDGLIEEDAWVVIDDDEELSTHLPVLVTLKRWLDETEILIDRPTPVGVWLRSEESPAQLVDALGDIQLIAVDFPAFTDGRSYSSARLLRERYGYTGTIRATGNVLRDQYAFMLRCGIDEIEIAETEDIDGWLRAAGKMTQHYQPAADGASAVWAKRHAAA